MLQIKKLLLRKTFVKLIDENLKPPPEINVEDSNDGQDGEMDDTVYRVAPAMAYSSRGTFTALVVASSNSSSSSSSSSSSH